MFYKFIYVLFVFEAPGSLKMEMDTAQSSDDGAYDCDSDSEGFVEDSVDDEFCFASGDIPKLQFRYTVGKQTRWNLFRNLQG